MSEKLFNDKYREHKSKIEKREQQDYILSSKNFYYYRSRERSNRHLRWGLRHRRSLEWREKGEFGNSKIFVGIFCFEIKKASNNLAKVNVANDSLKRKVKKTSKVSSNISHNSKKKVSRREAKKIPLELVPSKLGRHLKLC